ncbi:MAG: glycosyltransferase [Candidatus Gottesmanbacteria bacterium]|nr:glycosyltransferase [Candidatus Gottesmanbacteria bacterium]
MKIGFYSPYFDSMSGGERYLLTIASHWSKSHDVFLFWDDPKILVQSEKRFHIDLTRIRTTENVFKTKNVFKKLAISRGYDLIFFLTDGSIPTTFAKRNILHFQVPFQHIPVHPIKLLRFQAIVCNSFFTKDHLDPRVGKQSIVIYPPVEPVKKSSLSGSGFARKNVILSVGRFHPMKKQDVLIDVFRKAMRAKQLSGFELKLAGGLQPADKLYFDALKRAAKGLPVRFFPNCTFRSLTGLYNESLVYWHAAGYGATKPEHMEHFGITTVEAMSAGCIPVVFNGGGQSEIINRNLWTTPDECLEMTQHIIQNVKDLSALREDMIQRSKRFNVITFTKAFDALVSDIT